MDNKLTDIKETRIVTELAQISPHSLGWTVTILSIEPTMRTLFTPSTRWCDRTRLHVIAVVKLHYGLLKVGASITHSVDYLCAKYCAHCTDMCSQNIKLYIYYWISLRYVDIESL